MATQWSPSIRPGGGPYRGGSSGLRAGVWRALGTWPRGDLMALLLLPGSDLLDGGQDPATAQGSTLVEPDEQQVVKFERIVSEQALHRSELDEDSVSYTHLTLPTI